ncbi:MAG: glycyl-radical enzyme activating protein [Saprospiraceae bacterium]|nr:glycyl-radical enzyme activating protein [Saprospiraceae bacterium]
MQSPLIFNINKYAINDGPGIRMTIFLKGCPLNCAWCHNPESQNSGIQKLYTKLKCIGCMECVKACPNDACELTIDGIKTDPSRCQLCGICAEVCPTKATEMAGKEYSTDELLKIIEKERHFFDQSGGGITISGGEPLIYHDFMNDLFDKCGELKIHRAIDTSGFVKTDFLLTIAEKTELFLYDIKLMDSVNHKNWTGVGNELILSNLRVLSEKGANIEIRIPLIKGVNDDYENISKTAEFIHSLPGEKKKISILPYHKIAIKKYEKLGLDYEEHGMSEPSVEEQKHILGIFYKYGLEAKIGG